MSNNKIIKIGFVDTFDGTSDFFKDVLSERFEVIRDDVNPDYLIFGDENFGTRNTLYNSNKVTKIFWTGENRRPQNYNCHYAICFDHTWNQNIYRLPLYVLNMWFLEKRLSLPSALEVPRFFFDIQNKTEFCGFVNSNPLCSYRNEFFHKLSSYKTVASAGPLFNNVGYTLPRGEDGIIKKLEFLKNKKFSIAFENGSYPGYATEKMLEAYMGGTVPIYWGSPTIELDFNPRCFLNRHNYTSDEAFIKRIIEVDSNANEYANLYCETLFKDCQPNVFMDMNNFLDWFEGTVYHE